MSTEKIITDAILEWTNEGHEYLYDEKPKLMGEVEKWLSTQTAEIDSIYRRTSWPTIMSALPGEVLVVPCISSWSRNSEMPDQKYEGIDSVKLILSSEDPVRGFDVEKISPYHEEEEVLLAPCTLVVLSRKDDVLVVQLR